MFTRCCSHLRDIKRVVESPFDRFLVTDYYDGLRSGFAECRSCKTAFKVAMIDWDADQDVRIFRFHEVDSSPFRIVDELGESLETTWPFFVLFDKPANQDLLDRIERTPVAQSGKVLIIASRDPSTSFLASEQVAPSDLGNSVDWFRKWSLTKEGPQA